MAFRLRARESVAHGLRRMAEKELRAARQDLRMTPPADQAIHEARKRVKKVRAILELIEAGDGSGVGRCRKRLRRVNRMLSTLRDADAMIETLTALRARTPRLLSEHTFAIIRRQLLDHKRAATDAAEHDSTWAMIDKELRRLRRESTRWRPGHRRFGTLSRGIRSVFRRGRKARARAVQRQRAADFHDWRKAIQSLWHELRLVEDVSASVRRDIEALHRAESLLGEDHNVVVLCAELSKHDSVCNGLVDVHALREAATRYQRHLRRQAIAGSDAIYRRAPRQYVRRIKRAFNEWRRHAPGQERSGRAA